MLAPKPPYSVVRDLAAYDSTLRLRWGPCTNQWYLEKKLEVRHPAISQKNPPTSWGTSPRMRDLWPACVDGYHVIMMIPPEKCHSATILPALHECDLYAQGGAQAINRRLDALQDEKDKALDRELDTFVEAGSRGLYDRAQWLGKRKIQVPNDDVTVERITPVIHHEGFSVLDRRVTA
jgi:hypothetical protein